MGFHFKLEALRRYRLFEQEQRQKELADAQRNLENARACLADYLDRRANTEAEFREQSSRDGSAARAGLYRGYLAHLGREIEDRRRQVAVAEQEVDDKRQALLVAMKKRKALDHLKEKGAREYLENRNREEEKFINEMAVSRFNLRQP